MKWPGAMVGEVLRHVTKKPATVLYPVEVVQMPENFRGKIVFSPERCSGCNLCMKDCPSNAITINKVGNKRYEAVFDLDRCIYCAQCVDTCNRDALVATKEYELASLSRSSLRLVFHAPEATQAQAAIPAAGAAPAGVSEQTPGKGAP
jgi:formate hydrogenlyase subunit 6/NADH:ubiquinone oxidoreductase subunit I